MNKITAIASMLAAALALSPAARADTTYLSDLPFKLAGLHYLNGGYFDAVRVNDHASARTLKGSESDAWDAPTKIGGQNYTKSLEFHMVHDGTMKATWNLDGKYKTLAAMVGLDDFQAVPGTYPSVTVKFVGDGKALATTQIDAAYGKPNPTPTVNVSLSGVKTLSVIVTMAHADSTNLDVVNPELQTQ